MSSSSSVTSFAPSPSSDNESVDNPFPRYDLSCDSNSQMSSTTESAAPVIYEPNVLNSLQHNHTEVEIDSSVFAEEYSLSDTADGCDLVVPPVIPNDNDVVVPPVIPNDNDLVVQGITEATSQVNDNHPIQDEIIDTVNTDEVDACSNRTSVLNDTNM